MSMAALYNMAPAIVRALDSHPLAVKVVGSISLLLVAAYIYLWPLREYRLPYKNLPGPPPAHWFWGNIRQIIDAGPAEQHQKWIKEYGSTYRYRVFFGAPRVLFADTAAIGHVLSHAEAFPKPAMARQQLADILGDGVLTAEGAAHRRQRRILNPSFSPAAIRDMQPIFWDKAYELRDKYAAMVDDDTIEASPVPATGVDVVPGTRKIDVMRYLNQAAIDIIGLAGFNYDFSSLSQPRNELADAFRDMLQVSQEITFMGIVQAFVPGTRWIPTKQRRTVSRSTATMNRIGRQLVNERKRAVQEAGELEKGGEIGKDLLSLTVRANLAEDLRPDQRMSDDEVLAQITTFVSLKTQRLSRGRPTLTTQMLAGNETSATALTWILYTLSEHPAAQDRLRAEVLAVADERPSPETLAGMPYMENVIREVLRLHAPAPSTIRCAAKDDVVPLGKPVRGRDGKMVDSVTIHKGTTIFVPILCINTSESIWGPDASEFNPDRFDKKDKTEAETSGVPGVWGNLLTFLGGQRNCIGYRFALAEIRTILFVLVRSFEFQALPSKPEIERKTSIVMRPRLKSEKAAGMQMPLLVKPLAG